MKTKKQINRIVNYIKNGEKDKNDFSIGVEFEHFIIDNDTLETVSYYATNGVQDTLKEMSELMKADVYKNKKFILGFKKDSFTISTEPAAQFELSIDSKKSINDLVKEYKNFMSILLPLLNKKNQSLIALGYHPKTQIKDIKLLPKDRYAFMFDYFKTKGSMAHNMMKGTASVQAVIDFENEEDFKKKYFLGNVLAPIFYTIFDNSPIFENKIYRSHNLRQKIWQNTDQDRSGIFKIAFDKNLSYEKYAKFILETCPIFIEKDKKLIDVKDKLFKDIFDHELDDDSLIFHALSIVFPDLRVKNYLEFRMMDALPFPYNFSAVALIKGLFYNQENLDFLYEKYKNTKYENCINAKNSSYTNGLNAIFLNNKIKEHAEELISLAKKGLDLNEEKYLNPISDLINLNKCPKDEFFNILAKKDLKEAVFFNKIEV